MKLTTRVVVPRAASKQVGYTDKEYPCDRCGKPILPNTKMKVTLPRVGYDGNTHSVVYRRHFGVTCEKSSDGW